jgi:hypothetical protein
VDKLEAEAFEMVDEDDSPVTELSLAVEVVGRTTVELVVPELMLALGIDEKDENEVELVKETGRDEDALESPVVGEAETTEELVVGVVETTMVGIEEEGNEGEEEAVDSVLGKVDVRVKTMVEWTVTVSVSEELEEGLDEEEVVDGMTAETTVLFDEAGIDDEIRLVPNEAEVMPVSLENGAVPELIAVPGFELDEE